MRCDPDAVVRSMRWLRMITVGRGPRMVGELRFVFHAPRLSLQLAPAKCDPTTAVELDSKFELEAKSEGPCCHTRGNKNTRHKEP